MSKRVLYNITSASLQATNISGGTINATTFTGGNLSLSGDLKVAGTLTTVNITSTNLVNTNVSAGVVVASTLLSATGNSNTIGNIFTTSGNVGINTTSPANTLDVSGTIRASTSLTTGAVYSTNITSTNVVATNVSAATLYLSTGLTTATARISNLTITNMSSNNITVADNYNVGAIQLGSTINSTTSNINLYGAFTDGYGYIQVGSTTNTNNANLRLTRWGTTNATIANFQVYSQTSAFLGGNVGIGTTSPNYTLDVTGSVRLNSTALQNFVIGSTSGTANHSTYLVSSHGNLEIGIAAAAGSFNNSSIAGDVVIRSSKNLMLQSGPLSPNLYIATSGNIGIACTAPTHLFSVGIAPNGTTKGSISINTNDESRYHLFNYAGVAEWLFGQKSTSRSDFTFSKLVAGTETDYLTISTEGNVGIGTTSPGSILHVAGVAGSMPTVPSGSGIHMGIDINNNSCIQLNSGTNGSVNYEYIDFGYSGVDFLARIISQNSNRSLLFQVNSGISAMQLNSTGSVSITNLTSTNIVATNLSAGSLGFSNISVTSATIGTSLLAIGNSNTVGAIITTGGNVGIGTSSPQTLLHLHNTSMPKLTLSRYTSNISGGNLNHGELVWKSLNRGVDSAMIRSTSQAVDGLLGWDDAGRLEFLTSVGPGALTRMVISESGNVGIGTSSPNSKLHVVGLTSNTGGTIAEFRNPGNAESLQIIDETSSTSLPGGILNATGSYGIGVYARSGPVRFFTTAGNLERMRITETGNVGIGTTIPSFKLDVAGNGRFTGPGGVGTSGSVLITGGDTYGHSLYVASAASQKRIGLSHNGTVGNIFAFDYGSLTAQNLCLQFAGGGVGIGTTSPIRPLHVQGAMRLGGSGPALDFGDDYTTQIYRNATTSEMRFNTNSLERMTITSTGNVGIGTLSPESSLHVVGSGGPSGVQLGAESGLGYAFIQLNGGTVGSAGAFIDFGYSNLDYISRIIHNNSNRSLNFLVNGSGTSSMVIASTGNIGIGTDTPLAKLHIFGTAGSMTSAGRAYFKYNDGTTVNYNTGGWSGMSIYTNGDIATSTYFVSHGGTIQTSDSRIKKNIQDINTNIALEMLRQFKPKTYKFKDNIKNEDKIIYGFIAQEIKTIVPDAIRMTKKEVPNIFELADVLDGNKIILTKNSTSILKVDDEIMLYDSKNNEIKVVITNIIDDYTFIIDKQLNSEQINSENIDNKIFVYGQIVDDFHYLNKDHLFTITTSALQEIDQQLQSTKDIISNQKTEINDLKSDINYLKQTINDLMLRNNLI